MIVVLAKDEVFNLDLTGCCPVCYVPLREYVCRYDGQHTARAAAVGVLTGNADDPYVSFYDDIIDIGPGKEDNQGKAIVDITQQADRGADISRARHAQGAAKTRSRWWSLSQPNLNLATCSMREWLEDVDALGNLLQYIEVLRQNYDFPNQVVVLYALQESGCTTLDARFFEDCGVQKVGHRRLFEHWFAEVLVSPDDVS